VQRILLLLSIAVLVVAMLAITAVPAFATIHPLSRSQFSADQANGTVADTQDPPGLSGQSSADNIAQPVRSVLSGCVDSPEGLLCGTNGSGGTAAEHAFEG
jgi:hypothetical protein